MQLVRRDRFYPRSHRAAGTMSVAPTTPKPKPMLALQGLRAEAWIVNASLSMGRSPRTLNKGQLELPQTLTSETHTAIQSEKGCKRSLGPDGALAEIVKSCAGQRMP